MKKTQCIELLNTIKKTRVSFISIAFFVMLATTGYLCIGWSGEGFANSIENNFNEYNFEDCSVRFPYGLNDDYVEYIKGMDVVDDAEGVYQSYQYFKLNKMQLQARVISLPQSINKFTKYEGTLPTNNKEVALEKFAADINDLKIGDTITFIHDDDGDNQILKLKAILAKDLDKLQEENEASADGMTYLTNDTYTITAILDSPEHFSKYVFSEGFADDASQVDLILYAHDSSFDKEAFAGYSSVHLVSNSLRAYRTDTEEYTTHCDEFIEKVKEYTQSYTDAINKKLFDNRDALENEVLEKIEDGEKQLQDAKDEVESGKKQLASAKKQVQDGNAQIIDGQAQIDNGYQALSEGKNKLAEVKEVYQESKTVFDESIAIYDVEMAKDKPGIDEDQKIAEASALACEHITNSGIISKLKNLSKKYEDELNPLVKSYVNNLDSRVESDNFASARDEYNKICAKVDAYIADAEHQIEVGEGQLWLASCEIIEAKGKLENAKAQINANNKKIIDAELKIQDGEKEIEEAKDNYDLLVDSLKDIKEYDATIMGRYTNISVISLKSTNNIMSSFKYSLCSLFVIVGALVGYTSVSRLVHEQIILIGTKKALGLSQKEITKAFIIYSLNACLLGIIVAVIATRFIVEPAIVSILSQNFIVDKFIYYFNLKELLLFSLMQIIISVSAAFLASRKILKKKAIKLLAGPEEVIGKERFYQKFWLYKKLSLLNKIIVNNFFNDSRRVLGTLVGIAGCTSLLVCSLFLYFSVSDSVNKQKYTLSSYDMFVTFDSNTTDAEVNLCKTLNDMGVDYLCCSNRNAYIKADNGTFNRLSIMAYDNDEFYDYCHLMLGDDYYYAKDNVFLSEAFVKWNNLNVGDTTNIIDASGNISEATIDGAFERFLLTSEVTMTKEAYEKITGKEYQNNTILLKTDLPIETFNDKLSLIDGYLSIQDYKEFVDDQCHAITGTTLALVAVFFVLSITLAFLVLLNLLVMFVDERKKELIVMMINGYEKRNAKKYIYSDTIVLTILGIIFGSLLGTTVGIYTVKSLDSASTTFITTPTIKTYLVSAVLTFFMCALTTMIALRKIDKFKLTDINSK